MHARGLVAVAALALHTAVVPCGALAQIEQPAESPPVHSSPLISTKTAAVAGVILAATLLGDHGLRIEAQEHRGNTTNSLADFGNAFGEPRYVVPALATGYLVGQLAGSRDLKRVMLRTALAVAIAGGVTNGLKYSIGRGRPSVTDDSDRFRPFSGWNSFPSGHAAIAFAVATSLADETGDSWSDVALYTAAALTAFARVNDDRHWTSDVLVGGFIGHLSARWVSRQLGPVTVAPGMVQASLAF